MNKKRWIGSLVAVAMLTTILAVLYQMNGNNEDEPYVYSSRNEALIGGLEEIAGGSQSASDIQSWILDTRTNGNKEYCLFAVPYEESGIEKHNAFVAMVQENGGKYAFFKLTSDVALNTPGEIPDEEKTDSNVFIFDNVDGYYLCVGKVFDKDVVPFVDGQQLDLNADNIFFYITKDRRPEVETRKV